MYEVRAQWEGHVNVSAYGLQNRSMSLTILSTGNLYYKLQHKFQYRFKQNKCYYTYISNKIT